MSDRLGDSKHPYYATHGCYYVSGTLGSRNTGSYDGVTCHERYATWQAFKSADPVPFSADMKARRAAHGIKEPTPEELKRQHEAWGKQSVYSMDMDLNLLYRWDWKDGEGEDENGVEIGQSTLELFFMAQRKARPFSVTIDSVTDADEPEIRAWLWTRWCHMLRLWAPISGWPIEPQDAASPNQAGDEVHPLKQALEHVACEMATAAMVVP